MKLLRRPYSLVACCRKPSSLVPGKITKCEHHLTILEQTCKSWTSIMAGTHVRLLQEPSNEHSPPQKVQLLLLEEFSPGVANSKCRKSSRDRPVLLMALIMVLVAFKRGRRSQLERCSWCSHWSSTLWALKSGLAAAGYDGEF